MKRVLVVEDEAIVLLEIKQHLERKGFQVVDVLGADEALRAARTEHIDVACLDIMLKKGADGIDLAKRLKKEFHIPFLFATGNSDDGTRSKAMATGPVAYLVKPLNLRALTQVIEGIDDSGGPGISASRF